VNVLGDLPECPEKHVASLDAEGKGAASIITISRDALCKNFSIINPKPE
jgi:hypothetical protein